jgi:hypothetical protein
MPSRKEIVPNSLRLPYFARHILFFLFSSRKAHWDGQGTSDLMMIMPNMRTLPAYAREFTTKKGATFL